ncbi:lipopolysaccharide biosynthesis protein [Microbacterium sp. MMO-10]|uniref:lipopolysaccharide biosynthesis protein n=1 Tax=Microbacterium sp. MMO-10 TaxID=3081272 RepID=UPI003018A576
MFARLGGGAAAVGTYTLVLSIATPVFALAQFGLRTVYLSLRQEFPWWSYLSLRLCGIAAAWAFLAPYFGVTHADDAALWISVLILKAADLWFDLLQARLQRVGRLLTLGVLNLLNSGMTVVLALVLIWLTRSVALAVLGSAVVSFGVALTAWWLARDAAPVSVPRERGYGEIIRAGFPVMLAEALASASTYLPVLILSKIAEESRVGIYAVASYVLTFANLSGAILKNVLITPFRHTFEAEGSNALLRRSRRMAIVCALVGIAGAVPVVLLGGAVIRAMYGPEFVMSYAELGLLSVAAVPLAPSYIYSTTLNVFNRFVGQAWIWAGTIVLGVAAGIALAALGVDPLLIALAVAATSAWTRFSCVLFLAERFGHAVQRVRA